MSDKPYTLDRRRFVAAFGLIAGFAATPAAGVEQALNAARAYLQTHPSKRPARGLFDPHELQCVRAICDLVIPRTDTPGAVDADVHGFIDNQLLHCHSAAEQRDTKSSLAAIDRCTSRRFDERFADSTSERQLAVLGDIESDEGELDAAELKGYWFLKSMIVFGYCTSEAGATMELAFDPYPGKFVGSVPYREIGRAWFKG